MTGTNKQIDQLNSRIAELELAVENSHADSEMLSRRTEEFAAQTDCWFWETDANHVFNYLSDNFEMVSIGLSREDLVGKSRLDIISASESADKERHIDAILYQKPFRNFRYGLKKTDREIRHIVSSGWPVTNSNGEFIGYRGSARDETSEVVEHQTRLSRERGFKVTIEKQADDFRTVIENLRQSILWFDANGDLQLTNSRVAQINRLTDTEVESINTVYDYTSHLAVRGDLGEGDPASLAQTHVEFLRGELKTQQFSIVHLQAQQVFLRTSHAALPDGGFVITQVDITDQINTERALEEALHFVEESNQALEERVEERTKELRDLQSKLIRDERDATMNKLIATISHELRNPLNGLKASLYVIRNKVEHDGQLDKTFDRSERTIKRCENILSDLYDYSMTRELNLRPVNIGEWSQMNTDQIRLPENVSLEFTNLAEGVFCDIDGQVLTKAIWKVLSNALNAVTTDAPDLEDKRIYFTVRNHAGRLEFVIQDKGLGMSDETAQRATEPLFSTRGFGVGLGLPFAEQSLVQHGGGLKLKTTEGKGTTVTLWLPDPRVELEDQVA